MASTYLSATLGTATNRKKWTFSAWIKRSTHTVGEAIFSSYSEDSTSWYSRLADNGSGSFDFTEYSGSAYTINLRPNALQRDVNGWYHLVLMYDSAQSTASNRVKYYINGEQITSWHTESYPAQNKESGINKNQLHTIGKSTQNNTYYFNGSMSHIHFCDGYAYAASDFGSTDATTGEWKINTSPSVSYGTNGFFILKDGNGVTDQSPNSNNWTISGTLTKTEDCPSNVFATYNKNISQTANVAGRNSSVGISLINGNLSNGATAAIFVNQLSTLGFSKGKFYAEFLTTGDTYAAVGIVNSKYGEASLGAYIGSDTTSGVNNIGYQSVTGAVKKNNSTSYTGATYTSANDIVGVAVDMDNNYIYFSKNGTWQNSGDPTSGSTGTGGVAITQDTYFFASDAHNNTGSGTQYIHANFGNGYFGTSAISSAGTNASGNGIFEYDVPTGYTALSTKGLNL